LESILRTKLEVERSFADPEYFLTKKSTSVFSGIIIAEIEMETWKRLYNC